MIRWTREVLDGRADQPLLGGLDIAVRRNAFGRQVDSFETEVDVGASPAAGARSVHPRADGGERRGGGRGPRGRWGRPGSARWCKGRARAGKGVSPGAIGDTRLHEMFVRMIGDRQR